MEDVHGKTVLVIDDEPDVRLFLTTVLEDAGFEVQLAANGKQALDRMTERRPDVISLDLVMPRMSGLKFFKYIQKNPQRANIPVVVVTAHAQDELGSDDMEAVLRHKSAECQVFVMEKPVKATDYANRVREALGLAPIGADSEDSGEALRLAVSEKLRSADRDTLKEALRILSRP